MKSLTAVCQSGASAMPAINATGRISRQNNNHHPHHRDGENAEMKMYLSKLKDLVPFMPKNRKLSKLEIIQHVIDYICDLQSELETHPEINSFDAATALSLTNGTHHHHISSSHLDDEDVSMEDRLAAHLQNTASSVQVRQPLATRQSPNTILNSSQNNAVINSVILSNSQAVQQQQHQQHQYSHATTLIAPAASTEKQTADNKNSRQHC